MKGMHGGLMRQAAITWLLLALVLQPTRSFSPSSIQTCSQQKPRSAVASTHLFICSVHTERRGVEIPLLDVLDHEEEYLYVQPLPSTHLPDEMTILNVYGLPIAVPLHQSVLEYAIVNAKDWIGEGVERTFGHLAWKPSSESLIGAIGCAAEVLLLPKQGDECEKDATETAFPRDGVLCRGTYRFIVREIKQSFPFPIAIVDELIDDKAIPSPTQIASQANEIEDEDDDYAELSGIELVQRIMQAMESHVEQQLDVVPSEMSPWERFLVEQSSSLMAQRQAAQEMAAVWQVFRQYFMDLCPSPSERCFTLGFMAAEMINLSNEMRSKILSTTNGLERLRLVLRELESAVGMTRARQMMRAMTRQKAVDQSECRQPTEQEPDCFSSLSSLPSWVATIRKGTRIEYYNDENEIWVTGTVEEDPIYLVNEYLITVRFDDNDEETIKLPFGARDAGRWRPL